MKEDGADQKSEERGRRKFLMQVLAMMASAIFGFLLGDFLRWVRANNEVELNPLTWFINTVLGAQRDGLFLLILLVAGIVVLIKALRKDDEEASLGVDVKDRVLTKKLNGLVANVLVGTVFGFLIGLTRDVGSEYNPFVVLWTMVFPMQGGG